VLGSDQAEALNFLRNATYDAGRILSADQSQRGRGGGTEESGHQNGHHDNKKNNIQDDENVATGASVLATGGKACQVKSTTISTTKKAIVSNGPMLLWKQNACCESHKMHSRQRFVLLKRQTV